MHRIQLGIEFCAALGMILKVEEANVFL